jgi:hypothetical protein
MKWTSHVVVFLWLALGLASSPSAATPPGAELDALVSDIAKQGYFAGMVHVSQGKCDWQDLQRGSQSKIKIQATWGSCVFSPKCWARSRKDPPCRKIGLVLSTPASLT